MKVLIVAHGDDEVLWFNPKEFNKIIIVFGGRPDRPDFKEKREKAIAEHPLNVECWGLEESGYWRNPEKYPEYEMNYHDLCEKLKDLEADEVWTHNAYGEYGHSDHILVHNCCMEVLDCPVNGKDPKIYREIKDIYLNNGVWTWS